MKWIYIIIISIIIIIIFLSLVFLFTKRKKKDIKDLFNLKEYSVEEFFAFRKSYLKRFRNVRISGVYILYNRNKNIYYVGPSHKKIFNYPETKIRLKNVRNNNYLRISNKIYLVLFRIPHIIINLLKIK